MLQISTEVFVDAIMLAINRQTPVTRKLLQQLVDQFEEALEKKAFPEPQELIFYSSLLKEILDNDITIEDRSLISAILLRLKTGKNNEHEVIAQITEMLVDNNPKLTDRRADQKEQKIKNSLLFQSFSSKTSKIFSSLQKINNVLSVDKQSIGLAQILEEARTFGDVYSDISNIAENDVIEKIDFGDKDSLRRGFEQHERRTKDGVLVLGLQGLNRMFGDNMGAVVGESVCFGALSHNGKSWMLISIARWIAQYNTPVPHNTGNGVPTILFITLENEASQNVNQWYESAYEYVYQRKACHVTTLDEKIDFLHEFFNQRGYRLIIERRLGSDFGYPEFVEMYEAYRSAGFNIVSVIVDYLNQMKRPTMGGKSGDGGMRDDLGIKYLYTFMCNFCKNNGSTLFTAHQLNSKAADIVASGVQNPITKFTAGCFAGSMDVIREVDFVMFLHKTMNQHGVPYLCMQWVKHRGDISVKESHKYCAYRFDETLGIQDDYDKDPSFVTNIFTDKCPIDRLGQVDSHDGDIILPSSKKRSDKRMVEQLFAE